MKDKEKQFATDTNDGYKEIEKIAKVIEYAKGRVETWHCRDTNCEKCEYKNCKNSAIAEELIEQGYRKIPEDSVVLTKEEYEKYQRIENTIKRFSTISPTEAESENKALKEEIAIILAQKRNIWEHYNQVCNDKEKIFIEIYKLLISIRKQDDEDSVPYYSENVEEFDDKLYELAKQFGVEIKE